MQKASLPSCTRPEPSSSCESELHEEPLSFHTLLTQILADMKDRIDAADLEFVVCFDAAPDQLMTDSLYRVCQNLIENALKYAASGTRVFLKTFVSKEDLHIEIRRKIVFEITNTSGYPINFEKEEIVERFARGDKARSSEGNGLGLAIVSTYTAALGGDFDIAIDCDQFKARISFPLPEEAACIKS